MTSVRPRPAETTSVATRRATSANIPTIEIRPRRGWRSLRLREFWDYRDLVAYLALRDIQLRYKQTLLGIAWAVIQPVLAMTIFAMVFGRIAKLGSDRAPYPLFVLAGLLPWQLFSFCLVQSSASVVNEARLITKVYFPRLLLPVASAGAGLLDFGFSFLAFLCFALSYKRPLGVTLMTLPFLATITVLCSLAVGFWLAALTVRYRDFKYTVPFVAQIWLFASPVAYNADAISDRLRLLYWINPMVPIIGLYRWALLGLSPPSLVDCLPAIAFVVLGLVSGAFYFRRTEGAFADVV
jgi:lipopolysaccharide transport system permease protein